MLPTAVQPPGQERKGEWRAGEHEDDKVGTEIGEAPEVGAKLGPVLPGPLLLVPWLHQKGHQPFDLDRFRQQTLTFAFLQVSQERDGAGQTGACPAAH